MNTTNQPLKTSMETYDGDVVRSLHAAGHAIKLESKGPRRWTYHTSATVAQCLAAGANSAQSIPGGAPGYR